MATANGQRNSSSAFRDDIDPNYFGIADRYGETPSDVRRSFLSDFDEFLELAKHTVAAVRTTQTQLLSDEFLRRAHLVFNTTPDFPDQEFRIAGSIIGNLSHDIENVIDYINANDEEVLDLLRGNDHLIARSKFLKFEELMDNFARETEDFRKQLLTKVQALDKSTEQRFVHFMEEVEPTNDIGIDTLSKRLETIVGTLRRNGSKLSPDQVEELREATGEHAIVEPLEFPALPSTIGHFGSKPKIRVENAVDKVPEKKRPVRQSISNTWNGFKDYVSSLFTGSQFVSGADVGSWEREVQEANAREVEPARDNKPGYFSIGEDDDMIRAYVPGTEELENGGSEAVGSDEIDEPNVPVSKIGVPLSARTNGPISRKEIISARSAAAQRNAERRHAQAERDSSDPVVVAQRAAHDLLDLTRGIVH